MKLIELGFQNGRMTGAKYCLTSKDWRCYQSPWWNQSISANSAAETLLQPSATKIEFKKSLDRYFGEEPWEKLLSTEWKNYTLVFPETDIAARINSDILSRHFHETSVWDFVIKVFLITGLSRNTAGHHSTKINDLDNATLLIILKNAVYATYVIWKYAQRNQYLIHTS